MIREPGSSTLMHLRDDASATQRTADARGLVLHALIVLPHPEYRLAIGQGDACAFLDRLRVFARERENVGQEQFDALVHLVRSALAACEPHHAISPRLEKLDRKGLPVIASSLPWIKRRRP